MAAKKTTTGPTEKQGGINDFTLISKYTYGYRNREDITVLPPGVLVEGSQNVLTNTHQRVGIRKGYTLDGQANTDFAPIGGQNGAMGVFDWTTNQNGERNMRGGFLTSAGNDGKLQFRYVRPDGVVVWTDLLTGLTSIDFNFITFWDENSLQTLLLFVNGESSIRSWNGSYSIILSGANPTGIIPLVTDPSSTVYSSNINSGGMNYAVGNILTLAGGNSDATIEVLAVASGAINVADEDGGGTGYVVGDLFSIAGGTAPLAVGRVASVTGPGVVASITILGRGHGYSVAAGVATTTLSGVGTGLTIRIISVAGGAIIAWGFTSDANHGTGYSSNTTYSLTGGGGTDASAYINTVISGSITKEGTDTWAQIGFTFGSITTQSVIVDGVVYTYDNLDFIGDTTTLYGITPDPSGITPGSLAIQGIITYTNSGLTNGPPADFKNDLIGTLNARVFIGSHSSSFVYLSDYLSFTEYIPTLTFVLTNPPTGFIPQQNDLYITGGKDEWYQISFVLSADLTTQAADIQRINTATQQAAQAQSAITKIANSIVYLSFEPIIETFGPVANILLAPQITDLSYTIVNDMSMYNLTNASLFYYRKFVYVAVPVEGLVLAYNMTDINNPYWEAPQVMPISRFSIIDGDLYGHSSQVSETYKLFTGTNDNGFPILAKAAFSFNNYGTRSTSKGYNEFYVEGYISENTTLTLGIQYDIDGCATSTHFDITGDDEQIVCISSDGASLGKTSLGKNPLGSDLMPGNPTPKFRIIQTFPIRYFYEDQISFSSEGIDEQWDIVAFGPQLLDGGSLNNNITK